MTDNKLSIDDLPKEPLVLKSDCLKAWRIALSSIKNALVTELLRCISLPTDDALIDLSVVSATERDDVKKIGLGPVESAMLERFRVYVYRKRAMSSWVFLFAYGKHPFINNPQHELEMDCRGIAREIGGVWYIEIGEIKKRSKLFGDAKKQLIVRSKYLVRCGRDLFPGSFVSVSGVCYVPRKGKDAEAASFSEVADDGDRHEIRLRSAYVD